MRDARFEMRVALFIVASRIVIELALNYALSLFQHKNGCGGS